MHAAGLLSLTLQLLVDLELEPKPLSFHLPCLGLGGIPSLIQDTGSRVGEEDSAQEGKQGHFQSI